MTFNGNKEWRHWSKGAPGIPVISVAFWKQCSWVVSLYYQYSCKEWLEWWGSFWNKGCCGLNEKCSPLTHILNIWSPAGVLFRKVVESLKVGVFLQEVSHWGWVLRFYCTASLPVRSLLPDCTCNVASHTSDILPSLACCHVFTTIMDCRSLELSQNKLFFLTLLLSRYFITGTRK